MPRFPLAALTLLACVLAAPAENWPAFRGPTGQGLADATGLPLEWSTTKNVAWKQPIPGRGWSSPIVQDGRIYVTTAIPLGSGPKADQSLCTLCLDATTGKPIWKTELFKQDGKKSPGAHSKNSHASPTPLTDGKRLYVHFGHQGTAALDLDGNVLWRTNEIRYAPVHGNGGSPILAGDRLVFAVDGGDKQLVVALDCANGKVRWKTDRKSTAARRFSFGTPLLITVDGKPQIVSQGSEVVSGYDPADGKEIWRVKTNGYSVIPRPVFGHGLIFISSGYDRPTLLAIRAADREIVWSTKKAAPHTPSPLLVGTELYTVSDGGFASCFDAKTGKIHWQNRLEGEFSASPTYADGKVYFQSELGETTVVRASRTYDVLGHSALKEKTYASYAIADGAIYLRTETQLYCLRNR